jgi:integrase
MKIRLTQLYVNSIKPPEKTYWITDSGCPNLRLHVGSKSKVWYVGYRGENGNYVNHKLGPAGDVLTVAQARDMANDFMSKLRRGETPQKKSICRMNFGDFLSKEYEPWILLNHRSGRKTLNMLRSRFAFLLSRPLDRINQIDIEKWRFERQSAGVKASTINRCTASLRSVFSWALKRSLIESNPLSRLDLLKEHDSDVKVRYLTDDERKRLIAALDAREERVRTGRENHNEYLSERKYGLMPPLGGEFADYLKPMVFVSLHTGIRQNNLFSLKWGDIDFESQAMTLRSAVTKPGRTLRLPINSVVVKTLTSWYAQSTDTLPDALVFPSPRGGGKFNNCKKAWAALMKEAQIENFRWHDMRHDFASQLVMKGIDLNIVRELMGHADLQMTLRYAHLAPRSKLRAAEVLATI